MPIRFACPSCRTRLTAPEDSAGGSVRCPKCRVVDRVPAESETLVQSADETAEQPVPLFPSVVGELVRVEKSKGVPAQASRHFRSGFAWGAGFWLAGLAAGGIAVAVRAALGWAVG